MPQPWDEIQIGGDFLRVIRQCPHRKSSVHRRQRSTRHISTAIILIGVCSLAQLNSATWRIHLAVALAASIQLLALHFENRIPKPMLRVLGDAVLLSPLVLLWG